MDNNAIMRKYNLWLQSADEDADLIEELKSIENNQDEIYERFYRELEFGTGGLRGILGAGDSRMNLYTVRRATQGLANYLNQHYSSSSVAISFDSRIKSDLFAKEAARVLAANDIKVHIFDVLQPTPVLSWAVRRLGCQSGIMVTASHNPAQYNGYKCYGSDGCQMTDNDADKVTECIRKVDIFRDVRVVDFKQALASGMIQIIADKVVDEYLEQVEKQQINPGIFNNTDFSVVFTPLHGTGNIPVRKILKKVGLSQVHVVPEQEKPDGNFPTAPYPNPEIRQAFEYAIKLAEEVNPDILVATDPDCDRMGIAVKKGDNYELMSGNEVGCLLLNYILTCKKQQNRLPENPLTVKTIVTSDLVGEIAKQFNCEVIEVLTGFKYIGEQITILEQKEQEDRYVFGFEESYGYLAGTYVRDKDGVVAAMLVCEMAAYYKSKGKTLHDVLQQLYEKHGVYVHKMVNAEYLGSQGMEIMGKLMDDLRENRPEEIAGIRVIKFSDYEKSISINLNTNEQKEINLPKSNVLSFGLEHGASVIVRPSGTEPKIKGYITATGTDMSLAIDNAEKLFEATQQILDA